MKETEKLKTVEKVQNLNWSWHILGFEQTIS